jgi:hypothetical protein
MMSVLRCLSALLRLDMFQTADGSFNKRGMSLSDYLDLIQGFDQRVFKLTLYRGIMTDLKHRFNNASHH